MSRLFGWDLPPGCSIRDIEESAGAYLVCEICGESDCECPECPECGVVGDIECYKAHGMVLSDDQKKRMAEIDRIRKEEYEQERRAIDAEIDERKQLEREGIEW